MLAIFPPLFQDNFWQFDARSQVGFKAPSSWISGLTLTVTPPTYTQAESKTYQNTDGNLTVLEGSLVEGSAILSQSVEALRLHTPESREVSQSLNEVKFDYVASASGPWQFSAEQQTNTEFILETNRQDQGCFDQPPVVLEKPEKAMTVSENALLQLVYRTSATIDSAVPLLLSRSMVNWNRLST